MNGRMDGWMDGWMGEWMNEVAILREILPFNPTSSILGIVLQTNHLMMCM